ncbi:MAG: glycosyl transferase [Isosphaeraceae bacterium]|nr:MAG: glycosyl transferase [Isosphaeraceae bacterium]
MAGSLLERASRGKRLAGWAWVRAPWVEAVVVGLLALAVHLAGNDRTSLWDRDEPRYAGCAREMRRSGDYIHPTFNAEPRYHKPILTYWLMQPGVWLGGDNPFGNRLLSSVMGVGTCLLVWRLGRRLYGPWVGRIGALVMASSPLIVAEAKLATTDATLFFFLTLAMTAVWELTERASRGWAAVFWVAMALAILTKGPVAPVFLAASLGMAWVWKAPPVALGRLEWAWGLPLCVALAAPWYVAIGIISRGEFYQVAMGKHVLYRMTTGMETHGGFPGYYVVGIVGGMYPWSAFLPTALWVAWKRRREDRRLGFLAGWMLGLLVVLEIVRTKLIHYYLPALAGAALLVGWFVEEVAVSGMNVRRWPGGRLAMALLVGVGLLGAGVLVAGTVVCPAGLRLPCLVLAVVMIAGTLMALESMQRASMRRGAVLLGGTWYGVLMLAGLWLLPALEPYRLTPLVADRLRAVSEELGAMPVLGGYQPPGVVYNYGQPIEVRRDHGWLVDRVNRSGAVVMALSDPELKAVASARPELAIEVRETVRGINVERAREEALRIVVLRPGRGEVVAAAGKKPLVE